MKNEKARNLMWWIGVVTLGVAIIAFLVDLLRLWDPGSEVAYIFLGLSHISLGIRNWDDDSRGMSIFTLCGGAFILIGGIVLLFI